MFNYDEFKDKYKDNIKSFNYLFRKTMSDIINLTFPKQEPVSEDEWVHTNIHSIIDIAPELIRSLSLQKINDLAKYIATINYTSYDGSMFVTNRFNTDAINLHLTPTFYSELIIDLLNKDFSLNMAIRHIHIKYGNRDIYIHP